MCSPCRYLRFEERCINYVTLRIMFTDPPSPHTYTHPNLKLHAAILLKNLFIELLGARKQKTEFLRIKQFSSSLPSDVSFSYLRLQDP